MRNIFSQIVLSICLLLLFSMGTGATDLQEQGAAGSGTTPDGYGCVLSEDWDAQIVVEGFVEGAEEDILFKGRLKTCSVSGNVHLIARSYASDGKEDRPVEVATFICEYGTPDTDTLFCIHLQHYDGLSKVELEAVLNGIGRIEVSDVSVSCGDLPLHLSDKRSESPSQRHRTRHQKHSRVEICLPLDTSRLENLSVLCKVWGFLKYRHPAVRKGTYDWDAELFRMMRQTVDLDRDSRNAALNEWVTSLGDCGQDGSPESHRQSHGQCHAEHSCRFVPEWVRDTLQLSTPLSTALVEIASSRLSPYCHYLIPEQYAGPLIPYNEYTYPGTSISDDGIRLLALFRLWNYVEYFFPYKELCDNPWENALRAGIPEILSADTFDSLWKALDMVLAFTDDSHSNIMYRPHGLVKRLKYIHYLMTDTPYAALFISAIHIGDSFIVTKSFGNGTEDLREGDAILAVNGESAYDYARRQGAHMAASNGTRYMRDMASSVSLFKSRENVSFTVERDNDTITLNPQLYKTSQAVSRLKKAGRTTPRRAWHAGRKMEGFEIIDDSTVYVNPSCISAEDAEKCSGFNKMIIDLRFYPNNDFAANAATWFPQVRIPYISCLPEAAAPGHFVWTSQCNVFGGKDRSRRHFVVLVDDNTQSYAESMAMSFQCHDNVTTIGSQTAGADGQVIFLPLPFEFRAMVGGSGIAYPDGGQIQRCGVRIDETVRQSIQLHREGRDALIERAIEILNVQYNKNLELWK